VTRIDTGGWQLSAMYTIGGPGRLRRMDDNARALRLALRFGAVVLLICLLLPWFSGEDDGVPLKVAGWDTEPGFTVGMIAVAVVLIALSGARPMVRFRWVPVAIALVAVALTIWLLRRGDRYSTPDLFFGAYLTIAVEAGLLGLAVAIARTAFPRPAGGVRDQHVEDRGDEQGGASAT
jgi:hypothetical protein